MEYRELLTVALDFATAILLGALVGIEREKRKEEEEKTGHIAGLRTFILLALLGAAAGWLSQTLSTPWILAAALLIVGAVVVTGYFVTARSSQDGKGLTTEVAAVVVFLLGAMVMLGYSALAIGLGVVTSMAEFAKSGEARVAVISIVIAALSNTLVKCGMAFAVAGLALGKPLLMATVATLLAGLAAALLM
jgi:uncharacterized membrane protein (DUF4010 family)